jgi:sirohydrochlorin ferrochelatase
VICDHGSRKKVSNLMLEVFSKLYQEISGAAIVEIAHVEIAELTIEQAIGK